MKKKKYMLITVCDRSIMTEQFVNKEEALEEMKREMITEGLIPEYLFEEADVYDSDDYGFDFVDECCGFVNCGLFGMAYDWRIVPLEN